MQAFSAQVSEALDQDIQAELDAMAPEDTLSDAVWVAMQTAGAGHLDAATAEEKTRIADQYARMIVASVGPVGMLRAQLTPWDALWFFLALSTAWGLLAQAHPVTVSAGEDSGPAD